MIQSHRKSYADGKSKIFLLQNRWEQKLRDYHDIFAGVFFFGSSFIDASFI